MSDALGDAIRNGEVKRLEMTPIDDGFDHVRGASCPCDPDVEPTTTHDGELAIRIFHQDKTEV